MLSDADPVNAPSQSKNFWFNYADRNLFLAIATSSVTDWIAIGGSGNGGAGAIDWSAIANKPSVFPADVAAILNKIVVENDAVLTDGKTVIFED